MSHLRMRKEENFSWIRQFGPQARRRARNYRGYRRRYYILRRSQPLAFHCIYHRP